MVEKTLRISSSQYDQVKALADKGDLSIKDVADELVRAGAEQLNSLEKVSKAIEGKPFIATTDVNGLVYTCDECGHQLDPNEELDACPKCNTKLNWAGLEEGGGGIGIVGIGIAALAIAVALGFFRRQNNDV